MDTGIYDAISYPLTADPTARRRVRSPLLDYASLLKPRVVLLHLFTATVAMFLAERGVPPFRALALVLAGGGLAAGSANVLNCYFDRDLDRTMPRTLNRPLPAGRLSPRQALIFGLFCAVAGLSLLAWLNLAAAALALAALSFYTLVYTLWLKRSSTLSAVLSCGIGAAPPLIGWMAVTGHLALTPFLLFAVIALWTPPHFWALALARGEEYKKAGLSVLPGNRPALWLSGFVIMLVCASLILIPTARLGAVYAVISGILGAGYLILSSSLIVGGGTSAARRLYLYSIIYLSLLFAAMLAGLIL